MILEDLLLNVQKYSRKIRDLSILGSANNTSSYVWVRLDSHFDVHIAYTLHVGGKRTENTIRILLKDGDANVSSACHWGDTSNFSSNYPIEGHLTYEGRPHQSIKHHLLWFII